MNQAWCQLTGMGTKADLKAAKATFTENTVLLNSEKQIVCAVNFGFFFINKNYYVFDFTKAKCSLEEKAKLKYNLGLCWMEGWGEPSCNGCF